MELPVNVGPEESSVDDDCHGELAVDTCATCVAHVGLAVSSDLRRSTPFSKSTWPVVGYGACSYKNPVKAPYFDLTHSFHRKEKMAPKKPSSHKKKVKNGDRIQPPPVTKVVEKKSRGAAQDIGSVPNSDLGDYRLPPVPKTPKRSSKRARDDELPKTDGKKEKTVEAAKSYGGFITRLWSDEDEVTLLEGLIAFRAAPNAEMADFYDYIKGNLKFEYSREQLRSKVSRLKKKYLNALKKGKNGEDPVFSNPHEDRLFGLSKTIWGGSGSNTVQKGQNSKGIVFKEKEATDAKKLKKMKNMSKDDGGRTYPNPHKQEIYELSEKLWGSEEEENKASANGVHAKDAINSERMKSFLVGAELKGFDKRTLTASNHLFEEGQMEDEFKSTWKKLKMEETEVFSKHSQIKLKQAKHLQQSMNS
ncbi:DNA-binding storekeeper protein-related transcriptional regulator [Striga hermonthica]|uniref:DNA-binding storekeeper protein-related transcriptional regulator n=1 Tax=Striga hermonthica TaxID=68872 RepID=A0A9N7MMY0_STRHE|nr:DNA-binding storekeeper protein-related transcriptional regulator [Striga hermonthica]